MKIIIKVLKFILLAIVLTNTAYSQSPLVRSSLFSMTDVESNSKSIVRSYKPAAMLIASSYSATNQASMFTFIKNSTPINYVPLPYGYTINDFVILDSCIYFCGKNSVNNCGYIGMFDIPNPYQIMGGYSLFNIDSASNLTKLVAFNEPLPSISVVAIGMPKNSSFTSCVVDLNNYSNSSNNGWKYSYGHITGEEITDICDASTDLLITVGKPKAVSSGNGMVALPSKLYLRTYKKAGVLISGMENERREYSITALPSNNSGFLLEPIDGGDIAVAWVQTFGKYTSATYFLDILRININSLHIYYEQTITLSEEYLGGLVELEYFPNTTKLGVVLNKGNNIGELILADISQIADYAASKLWHKDYLLNSITHANNDNFALTCKSPLLQKSPHLLILHENLNTFSESNCTTDETIQAKVNETSLNSSTQVNSFTTYSKDATSTFIVPSIEETDVEIHCANYYK